MVELNVSMNDRWVDKETCFSRAALNPSADWNEDSPKAMSWDGWPLSWPSPFESPTIGQPDLEIGVDVSYTSPEGRTFWGKQSLHTSREFYEWGVPDSRREPYQWSRSRAGYMVQTLAAATESSSSLCELQDVDDDLLLNVPNRIREYANTNCTDPTKRCFRGLYHVYVATMSFTLQHCMSTGDTLTLPYWMHSDTWVTYET